MDVSHSSPSYSVRDVISPYGLLRDSIPVPGDVIEAMSTSIEELKSNFAPTILLGPPTSLTFVVDEGRGFTVAQDDSVTNIGVYGSLLSCTLTTSSAWTQVTPANVGNLSLNESGLFSVNVDSTTLLASSSPYASAITIQDPTATNPTVVLPFSVTVRPKALVALNTLLLTFTVVKPLSGPFPSIPTQGFTVTNGGPSGSVLEFEIQKLLGISDWLTSFLPSSSSLNSSQSQGITVTVIPPDTMVQGTYNETLRVSGYSSNSYLDIQIRLVIS